MCGWAKQTSVILFPNKQGNNYKKFISFTLVNYLYCFTSIV